MQTAIYRAIVATTSLAISLASQTNVTLRVVDQDQVEITGSWISVLGNTYQTGTAASLPTGSHDFVIAPAVFGTSLGSQLYRTSSRSVDPSTTELVFEWITAGVHFRAQDQNGTEIPGSLFQFPAVAPHFATGDTVRLPITDNAVYSGLSGSFSDGYDFSFSVAVMGYVVSLWRMELGHEVTASTTDMTLEWITSDVAFRAQNQNGQEIVGSHFQFVGVGPYVQTGSAVRLPITDDSVYPGMSGNLTAGYDFSFSVAVMGYVVSLWRMELDHEVTASTTDMTLEWITSDVTFRAQDQLGSELTGSVFQFVGIGPYVATGSSVRLPITDDFAYPGILGSLAGGYRFSFSVAPMGQIISLWRMEEGHEVDAATSIIALEWITKSCALSVVDAAGMPVAGSTIQLPAGFPSPTPQPVVLPTTENAVYPTIQGTYANGYPITVSPGDVAPSTGTFQFEVLESGHLEPGAFEIDGNTYSLVCQANRPPVADGGPNRAILSSQQPTTTIAGTASDPDGGSLTYRWLEGTTLLFGPATVGPNGEAPLDLGGIPSLSIGMHTLTLEVSDCCLTIADDMVLTVGNSPPAGSCTGAGTYQAGIDAVVLAASVTDYDGDSVFYQWRDGSTVLASGFVATVAGGTPVALPATTLSTGDGSGADLAVGAHTLTLTLDDGANAPVTCSVVAEVVDTDAPRLAPTSSHGILWPPNHAMVDVTIAANASDASGGPVYLTATVASSEDALKEGSGNTIPDFTEPFIDQMTGTIYLQLRAERAGKGPGRTYTVTVTATDAAGNSSVSPVLILAPHDKGGS